MKEEKSKSTNKAKPCGDESKRVLGFYFDEEGKIKVLEIGLNQVERLALLNYAQTYSYLESRHLVIKDFGASWERLN